MKRAATVSVIAMACMLAGCAATSFPAAVADEPSERPEEMSRLELMRQLHQMQQLQRVEKRIEVRPPEQVAPPEAGAAAQTATTQVEPRIDITPLTGYSDLDRALGISSVAFHHNAYTRLTIVGYPYELSGSDNTKASRVSGYQEDNWFRRYFIGLKRDISLSVKMRSGSYEETVSLATLSSTSDRNGLSWNRDVVHDVTGFPWFLVTRDASAPVPRIAVQARYTRAMESGVATATLQATLGAIKAVSPQSTVVTTLSEPATRDRAAAIDQVINNLFASEINETHHSDRNLVWWRADGGIRVAFRVPKSTSDWNGQYDAVGSWAIGFAPPRPSLFSEWHICQADTPAYRCKSDYATAEQAAYATKNAANILRYPLIKTSSGVITIRKWILQEDWYTSAQSSFISDARSDKLTANALCLTTAEKVTELGLNDIDAALVTWAMMKGLPPARAMDPTAWTAPDCAAITQRVG